MNLNVQVKVEPGEKFDETVNSKECTSLYENHVIKDELVIGPEIIHGAVLTESTNKTVNYDFKVEVKIEKPSEDSKPSVRVDVKIERQDSTEECAENDVPTKPKNKKNKKSKQANKQKLSCSLCPQQFTFKTNLSRHMKVHETGKKYTCDLCDRKCIAKWNLTQHLRGHSNLKYECKICHKSIADRSRYKSHVREHYTGVKAVKKANVKTKLACNMCNKTYFTRKSLSRHIQDHYESNRFLCHVCSKSFSRLENLYAHLNNHDNKMFSCAICKKKFLRECTAKMHEKKCRLHK